MNALGIDKPVAATRVVVAMSGGVDSSVVAALLKSQGYEVIGITLQLYDHGMAVAKKGACCAGQDVADAKAVAARIGIAHYVLDYESRFKQAVIDDFADTYLAGATPIPCVRCNQRVKFRDLLQTAQDLGADALATGHYVRRVEGADGPELWRAVEAGRDQSYFLFATTRAQLAYLRFPLGGMLKAETRALAAQFGLAIADKPDSQDICFVPNGNYASVVEKLRPEAGNPGNIVHSDDGRVLGRHQGIINFTVGQRRGIGIGGSEEPLYVTAVDAKSATVTVGPHAALARDTVYIKDVSWLAPPPVNQPVAVKLRSAQAAAAAYVRQSEDGQAVIELAQPQFGVSPGQACVVYHGERVLGGGWIEATGVRAEKLLVSAA